MPYYADVYVIQESRSKDLAVQFLDFFLPYREESSDDYCVPQYSSTPIIEFEKADGLMTYLESESETNHAIYWRNLDEENLNKHGMIFYTEDGCMIFGISRDADMSGGLDTKNEDICLREMKDYFETDLGYIHYENPPVNSLEEFIKTVKQCEDYRSNLMKSDS